jgi:hypothetical protein
MARAATFRWIAFAALLLGATTAASAEPVPVPVTTLGPIVKEHNVPGVHGMLFLRLHVPATIVREKGADVALGVWFADESGTLLWSNLPEHKDASGLLKAESPTVRVAEDPEKREFVVAVPYAAFPRRKDGTNKYSVEARAILVRRSDPQSRLALATTKFFVES